MNGQPDVYSQVTNKIIADLECGSLTWLQPWRAGHAAGEISRPLRVTGKPYRGINIVMLWASAMEKGFSCPIWLTYKQAVELGGQVRKGIACCLRRYIHQNRNRRQGRKYRNRSAFHEGLHSI